MKNNDLFILWTNADSITFKKMISMYAYNGLKNDWWDNITIIIWGSPAELVANDKEIQNEIKKLIDGNVKISACKACADQLGATDTLENLNIEVKYWGVPLTELIKNKENLITI